MSGQRPRVSPRLTRKEALLLRELMECKGRVVTHEAVLGVIGVANAVGDRKERRRVSAYISFLRQRFGSDVIITVRAGNKALGYMVRADAS